MNTVQKSSLAGDLAGRLVGRAEQEARERGLAMSIAVVDESGVLKAFARMDGAVLLTVQIAQDKAYTAAGYGLSTESWREMFAGDAVLGAAVAPAVDRLFAVGGGVPVVVDGVVVGAVGVSGGTPEQDVEVAEATVRALVGARV
jgi:uncharacterized protein GlcG (DUF336 family)